MAELLNILLIYWRTTQNCKKVCKRVFLTTTVTLPGQWRGEMRDHNIEIQNTGHWWDLTSDQWGRAGQPVVRGQIMQTENTSGKCFDKCFEQSSRRVFLAKMQLVSTIVIAYICNKIKLAAALHNITVTADSNNKFCPYWNGLQPLHLRMKLKVLTWDQMQSFAI